MRLLPPSSRSFHSATYDIRQDVSQLRQEIDRLREQLDRQSAQINEQVNQLSSDIAVHDAHMKLYGDVFFRQEDETPHETRKRFSMHFQKPMNPSEPSSSATVNCFINWKSSARNIIWITGFGLAV